MKAIARGNTSNRRTLFKTCGTCGKSFTTSVLTPFARVIVENGRQITTYFCSEKCKAASYKRVGWYFQKERDRLEYWKIYYVEHKERILEKAKKRYRENPKNKEQIRADNEYNRKKKKLLRNDVKI